MTLGDWVREQRNERRWTQAELALRVGVNSQTVSRWERSEFLPDVVTLKQLCKLFECSADAPLALLSEAPPPPPVDKGAA